MRATTWKVGVSALLAVLAVLPALGTGAVGLPLPFPLDGGVVDGDCTVAALHGRGGDGSVSGGRCAVGTYDEDCNGDEPGGYSGWVSVRSPALGSVVDFDFNVHTRDALAYDWLEVRIGSIDQEPYGTVVAHVNPVEIYGTRCWSILGHTTVTVPTAYRGRPGSIVFLAHQDAFDDPFRANVWSVTTS